MTDLLKEEARPPRNEAMKQWWIDKGMYLTQDKATDDEPCSGCGASGIDNLGNRPGTRHLADVQHVD